MHRLTTIAFCIALLSPMAAGAQHLTIDGSRTMYAMNTALVKRFEQSHPGASVAVSDSGTGKAFEAVARRKADLGAVTHDIRPEDRRLFRTAGTEPLLIPIALEGISIYVHPRNPVNALTVDQLAAIYSGAITNWKAVGGPDLPIHVNSFDVSTGRYWYMADDVMQKKPMARGARFTDEFASAPSAAARLEMKERQMLGWVSSDPGAIGFGDLKKMRVVKIVRVGSAGAAALPTPADIKVGRYPLARRLAYLARKPLGGVTEEFVRWAGEQEDIIRDAGFVPLHE